MIPADLALLRVPGAPAILPDGRSAVVSVVTPDPTVDQYVGQLWTVPLDGSGQPRRLTRGHRDTTPQVSPDGRWVAFVRNPEHGPGQVHVVEATGGEPRQLTDAPLGAASPVFSPDGTRIAYLARVAEEGRYVEGGEPGAEAPRLITEPQYRHDGIGFVRDRRRHAFVTTVPVELDGPGDVPPSVRLTTGDLDVSELAWLPDGRFLVAGSAVHAGREADLRSDVVVIAADVDEPREPRPLTRTGERDNLGVGAVLPSRDGARLWFLAQDLGPDGLQHVAAQNGLFELDLAESADGPVAPSAPRRRTDVEAVDLTDGLALTASGVLVSRLERGAVVLAEVPADPAAPERVLLGGAVVLHGVTTTPDGARAVATVATPGSAGDLVVVDLATGESRVVTDLSAELRATGRVQEPRELTTVAPDGYPVHGWVVTPDTERFGAGPHPTILMIHGGPYAQYTSALFDEVQVLAEAGYAVVYGNPRGSAGYGSAHGRAIQGAFGVLDTQDVLALLDTALEDPRLDGARIGVMGGSYGGYLTAWLTTQTHRFAAAIVERGFLDPVSFLGSSDIGWFFGLGYLGDHGTPAGAAAVAAQSPMAHVGDVRTPTLVIHSEQDWRCPVEQGQRWFVELKRRGVETELLLFPGEGHELTRSGRPAHRLVRFEHVLRWWSRHLPV